MKFQHRFVDFIPDRIDEGVLYISLDYGTVIHKCACGCGNEVNTPLTPNDWKMIYNGDAISLKPSVGNWSFDCKSHYWITNNSVEWALMWDDTKIHRIRKVEDSEREEYYLSKNFKKVDIETVKPEAVIVSKSNDKSWFDKLMFWK